MESKNLFELFNEISKYSLAVRNNGGGHYNHMLYWASIGSSNEDMLEGKLMDAIKKDIGSFEAGLQQLRILKLQPGDDILYHPWCCCCCEGQERHLFTDQVSYFGNMEV